MLIGPFWSLHEVPAVCRGPCVQSLSAVLAVVILKGHLRSVLRDAHMVGRERDRGPLWPVIRSPSMPVALPDGLCDSLGMLHFSELRADGLIGQRSPDRSRRMSNTPDAAITRLSPRTVRLAFT